MTITDRVMLWVAMTAAILAALWSLFAVIDTVGHGGCAYLKPVPHHAGSLKCSRHP